MKASDVFVPTRRSYFTIPEIDISKADLGRFDPKVGMLGGEGAAAPRGLRPGKGPGGVGMVYQEGQAPRHVTPEEQQKMSPTHEMIPESTMQAIAHGVRQSAAQQKPQAAAADAPPPVKAPGDKETPESLLALVHQHAASMRGAGVSQPAQPMAAQKAFFQGGETDLPGQQPVMQTTGSNDPLKYGGGMDPHHQAAYHLVMEAHHRGLGNHGLADQHASQAKQLTDNGVQPEVGHFRNMMRATEGERAKGTQALQGLRQKHIESMRRSLEKAEKLAGGIGDNKPDSDFNAGQLTAGMKVEEEHTKDKKATKEIAKDHLTEDKDYYKKLKKMEKSLAMMDDLSKASTALAKRTPGTPAKRPSTGMSMTTPQNYSTGMSSSGGGGYSMSSTSPSSMQQGTRPFDGKKQGAIDVEFQEVKPSAGALPPKPSAAPSSSQPSQPPKPSAAPAGPGTGAKMLPQQAGPSSFGGTPGAPSGSPSPAAPGAPAKTWPAPGSSATGANIVPRMTSTTGGAGTLHPGPQQPPAGASAGAGGPPGAGGGAGGKPGGGKEPKQKQKKLMGPAFGQGYGQGLSAGSDAGSAAGGKAPIATAVGALMGGADVRGWRSSGSVPMQPGEQAQGNAGRAGQMRTPSLRLSQAECGPVLYIRSGARTFVGEY